MKDLILQLYILHLLTRVQLAEDHVGLLNLRYISHWHQMALVAWPV